MHILRLDLEMYLDFLNTLSKYTYFLHKLFYFDYILLFVHLNLIFAQTQISFISSHSPTFSSLHRLRLPLLPATSHTAFCAERGCRDRET